MSTHLDRAIALAGNQTKLAELIASRQTDLPPEKRCRQQNVWWWKHKSGGTVPPAVARIIQDLYPAVTMRQLRPDVFGAEPSIEAGQSADVRQVA